MRSLCPCGKPVNAQGLCHTHYWRLRHHGDPGFDLPITTPRKYASLEERITRNIQKDPSGCWLWTYQLDTKGYGVIGVPGRQSYRAHRLSYEVFVGPIPEGLQLDHLCSVRACVNPDHLEPVTHQENLRRARPTVCKRGHPLSGDNLLLVVANDRTSGVKRRCRECYTMKQRARVR